MIDEKINIASYQNKEDKVSKKCKIQRNKSSKLSVNKFLFKISFFDL
jgi:hypothetical protein